MKNECSRQIFEKFSNIKFYESPFSGSRFVPCGRTNGRTGLTKPIVGLVILRKRLKSKVSSVPDTKACKGGRNTAALNFNLGTRWICMVSFKPRPLYHWERILVRIEMAVVWAPETVRMFWRVGKYLALPGLELWTILTVASPRQPLNYSNGCSKQQCTHVDSV
jgi:hypothetical protein